MSGRAAAGWGALGAGVGGALVLALLAGHDLRGRDDGDVPATPAAAVASDRDGSVQIAPGEQQRIGVTLAPVTASVAPLESQGFARGLDAAPLATIEADIATAQAALGASQAEAARLALLASQDQSASQSAVQAAQAQAAADRAKLQLARGRVALEYGPGLARLSPAARHALVADIGAGRAALLRIDLPGAAPGSAPQVRLAEGGGTIRILGPAAAADPRLQSAGVLAILTGPAAAGASSGRVLPVQVAGSDSQHGVTVPRDAVLRWRGGLWVYRQTGPAAFARVELVDARPVGQGWFVPAGLAPGDRVVLGAAATLLAIDRGGGPADGDD